MIKFILSLFIFLTSLSDASGKTLVIATGEWPPYISKTEEKYGCVGKLIVDSFKTQGITVQYTFFPWKRAYELAKAGQFDATAY
ncbi:MAG: hypothetical protein BM556_00495 [Bacteriovorax sp. MedPE-SWde]|nr:MAG: hypothetical protein BM556_00495 [Bacteriovorax sp. MedPE-SWde]